MSRTQVYGLFQANAEIIHIIRREQQVDAQPDAGPSQVLRRTTEPGEDAWPARGVEPIRTVGGDVDDSGVPGQRLDDLRAVDGAVGGHIGDHPAVANRGQQIGEVGQQGGLAPAQSDFEDTPCRQSFDDPLAH